MTQAIVIVICSLLLLAYIFDLTSSFTKIPSVILLLLLGWLGRQIIDFLGFKMPDFSVLLPVIGTIGLILIVLEGAMELKINKSKVGLINKSLFPPLISMLALAFLIAVIFHYYGGFSFIHCLINAVPFCVISSAIAIPSVKSLAASDREFVVYESSLSDITGVLFFNFISLNETFDISSLGHSFLQLIIITLVSLISTVGLSFLLSKIEHHVKFIPIIVLVILIYAITKSFHLPSLIFILLFGIVLGNLEALKRFKWIEKFRPDILDKEVKRFKELTFEASFLIRAIFFLLFGYLIDTNEVLNTDTIIWAVGIVAVIYIFRYLQLKFSGLAIKPLIFAAPRGLITVLLFLSIEKTQSISLVNKSLVIQVVLLTAFIMMAGFITTRNAVKD